jgi:hypothetical protein
MTNPNEEKVDAFFPLEAVEELARLRQQRDIWNERIAKYQVELEETAAFETLTGAEENLGIAQHAVVKAEMAFKAGCEDIFEETDEKKFPGGQIKMKSIFEYNENLAVKWAIKHDHPELLKIIKKEFKDACKALAPKFVRKDKVGKMYIDSDLSQYLESNNELDQG